MRRDPGGIGEAVPCRHRSGAPTPWPGSGKARQCSLLVSDCHLISSTRSW